MIKIFIEHTFFFFVWLPSDSWHAIQKSMFFKKKHKEKHLILTRNEKISIPYMKLRLFLILTRFKLWEKVEIYG